MGRMNAVGPKQNFKDFVRNLAGRGKPEMRAKMVNDQWVLYKKSVNSITKLVDNLFFNRRQKLDDARAFLNQKFSDASIGHGEFSLSHARRDMMKGNQPIGAMPAAAQPVHAPANPAAVKPVQAPSKADAALSDEAWRSGAPGA